MILDEDSDVLGHPESEAELGQVGSEGLQSQLRCWWEGGCLLHIQVTV